MSESVKSPPYPADVRAKGWRFELDYERIDQSDTWDLAAEIPMAQPALLMMWMTAWRQAPAGSLPNDEAVIRAKCRIPAEMWSQMRDVLMRGWWLADDGRLYHDKIVDLVLEMMGKRRSDADRQAVKRKASADVMSRDGGQCIYCGSESELTVDHLLPKKLGGDSDPLNLAAACKPCNSRKKDRTPEQAGMAILNVGAAQRWRAYRESRSESQDVRSDSNRQQHVSTGVGSESDTDHRPPTTTPSPPVKAASIALVAQLPPPFAGDANESSIQPKARVTLAAGWELPTEWGTDAEALGWRPSEILKEAEKFRQYWVRGKGQGTRRTIKGWRQSWSNWLGKAERYAQ